MPTSTVRIPANDDEGTNVVQLALPYEIDRPTLALIHELDSAVQDAATADAAVVNNRGVVAQLKYLLARRSPDEVQEFIDRVTKRASAECNPTDHVQLHSKCL